MQPLKDIMKYLLLLILCSGCLALTPAKPINRRDTDRLNFLTCVKDLFNSGFSEENAHLICMDIYYNS